RCPRRCRSPERVWSLSSTLSDRSWWSPAHVKARAIGIDRDQQPTLGRVQGAGPMAKFQTLDDIDIGGKRVLLRADLNVPVKDGVVTDATRIQRLAPTIEALIEKGAKVIVMSHFGRPK